MATSRKKTVKKPRPAGRPTSHNAKMVTQICQRLASGESLRSICADETMPAMSTVLLWVVEDRGGFSEHYAQAREAAGYAHADRIIDTVEKTSTGQLDAQTARAMMDGLKWAAERMAPKRHSPRQDIAHTSPDGSMSPPTKIVIVGHDDSNDKDPA